MAEPRKPRSPSGRPANPVDTNTPGGRLRALRDDFGLNQEQLAEVAGVTRSVVSRYEIGNLDIPDPVILRLARRFGVTPSFLRYGDRTQMAPVMGFVGAGGHVEAAEGAPIRHVEIPSSWSDALALQVKGLSCYPIYEDGDALVIRGAQRLAEDEFLNRMSVVETADGLGLVKRVRRGSASGLYTLESPNAPPIEDVRLTSARPICLHIPKPA
ncbi:helix-turn-helix transcriptional regulator [Phenylobacterium sp.]|uniref:LexA family transcriptional regulator n=1 Tax=Phenylobacterium sp. TaxID=1871053 RepID=UPI0035B2F2BE